MTSQHKHHILFYANVPNNVVCFRPIYDALCTDDRLALHLTSSSKVLPNVKEFYDAQGMPDALTIPRWMASWRRFDLYLSPNLAVAAKRSLRKAQMFHGVSFKGRPYRANIKQYDYLFTVGPYMKRRFIKEGFFADDDSGLLEIGMPKTDPLVNGVHDRAALAERLGFADQSAPLILYAPTWRKESSLYTMGRDLIKALPQHGLNLMVKLHDHFYDPSSNNVDWKAEMERLAHPNLRLIEDSDIIPYLSSADLLISDLSSVANEFCLLDRPIVFLHAPRLYEKYGSTLDMDTWGLTTGDVAENSKEILPTVKQALASPERHGDIRRQVATDLFYNPGQATPAAVSAVYRLLQLAPPPTTS